MDIKYALVRFTSDNLKEINQISRIKDFFPKHETDFIKNRKYKVLWQDNEEEDVNSVYSANILLLGSKYQFLYRLTI